MIGLDDALIALVVALVVGLSKTAMPGAGLLATPLVAIVFGGRQIPGAALPILLLADTFAVRWYRHAVRWEVLRPLVPWVAAGFAAGATFFVAVGSAEYVLELVIGVCILIVVVMQTWRMVRGSPDADPTTAAAAGYGTSGGFTTFVSNNAGPIINAYLLRLGLGKEELVGTSAWFYFVVNLAKVPIYLALGALGSGGPFFTAETLVFGLVAVPGVLVGVTAGRALFTHIPQRLFAVLVLVLSAISSLTLIID